MTIGEFINNYLLDHQMSQRQFAKKCNFSNGYISMLINNVNPKTGRPLVPSLTALLSIARAMGITLDELINTVDDMDVDISAAKNLPAAEKSNGRVNEFVELFSQLTDEQKSLIVSQIKGILSNQ